MSFGCKIMISNLKLQRYEIYILQACLVNDNNTDENSDNSDGNSDKNSDNSDGNSDKNCDNSHDNDDDDDGVVHLQQLPLPVRNVVFQVDIFPKRFHIKLKQNTAFHQSQTQKIT